MQFPSSPTLAWWAAFVSAGLLLVAPLAVVDLPPLLDYPNHLARMMILAAGTSDLELSRFWSPAWGLLPNLATDLVIPPLTRIMPLEVAGRVTLGAILLLQFLGVVVYHRVAFATRSLWPLAGALVACNAIFLLGFMNFLAGMGPALLVAALWIGQRDRRPALAIGGAMLGLCALFFCHIFAVLFCAALIGGQEAASVLAGRQTGARVLPAILCRSAALALVIVPVGALYVTSSLSEAASPACWVTPSRKATNLLVPFLNYYGALDLVTALVVLGVVAIGIWRGRLHRGTLIAFVVLFAIYLVAPFQAKGAAFIDARIPVMLGLLLFAGVQPRLTRALGVAAVVVLAVLHVVRSGAVAVTWAGHAQDLAEIRQSIAPIAPGSRVLVATAEATPEYWRAGPRSRVIARFMTTQSHLGALVTLERRALMPLLFAVRSQQPLRVQPAYQPLAVPASAPPDYRALARQAWSEDELEKAPYLPRWQSGFDYVLVLMADAAPDLQDFLPDRLALVNNSGMAALFRVRPPGVQTVAAPAAPLPRRVLPCGFS